MCNSSDHNYENVSENRDENALEMLITCIVPIHTTAAKRTEETA